ncbi:hypothetical protein F0562_019877 [Nyssa sinensis]|uniref:Uncharacterized protein n=1 Tax=Nyssa sinensis TaxID=561372 RepID=A0A5J5BPL4_9ASTE|nr:hypothetical protein F0562_019877 [Nyssa sinensis]
MNALFSLLYSVPNFPSQLSTLFRREGHHELHFLLNHILTDFNLLCQQQWRPHLWLQNLKLPWASNHITYQVA